MRRTVRPAVTLALTLACAAYLVWKIDLGQTLHVLGEVQLAYFAAALALLFATVPPLAWRWRLLLRARGIDDGLGWLMRAYLVAYAAGQVLPTSLGGDATRIFETTRRHPGRGGAIAGSVLLERVLGGFATLVLAALGFVLAYGQYDVGAYLWIELAIVVAAGLARGESGRRRPLAAAVLRDGPAALPGDAGAVHHQRIRPARDVLRQLPRQARRRPRRCVRNGLPLLLALHGARPAGRRHPRLARLPPRTGAESSHRALAIALR